MTLVVVALLACRGAPEERRPEQVSACTGVTSLTTTGVLVSSSSAGCGTFSLENITILGDGAMRLEWFTDGESAVPVVIAEEAAVWEGIHAQGAWTLAGEGAPALWRQSWQPGAASGVSALIAALPRLSPATTVGIAQPTYNEHAASFDMAGWQLAGDSAGATVLVHPNNPDGHLWQADALA